MKNLAEQAVETVVSIAMVAGGILLAKAVCGTGTVLGKKIAKLKQAAADKKIFDKMEPATK